MKAICLCLASVLLLQLVTEGEAVCCHGKGPLWRSHCADCSKGTPYCSAGKSCNVFGCNCDGGCRTGPCLPPLDYYPAMVSEDQSQPQPQYPPETATEEVSSYDNEDSGLNSLYNEDSVKGEEDIPMTTAEDIIQDADENGDGLMDADEAESYLSKRGLEKSGYRLKRSLYELDINNDYFITADELDPYN